jgi:flagellar motor switch protein FliN/FliY
MSDILSQDQIDALLNAGGFDSGSPMGGSGVGSSTEVDKYPILKKYFDLFLQEAGTVISTVLNKKTAFESQSCEKANFQSAQNVLNTPVLSLALSFKSGFEGEFYFVIQKKDVAILSDLMMMGDGSADYTEDHKDAITELFSQVMGAYSTSLGAELGSTFSAAPVQVSEFDFSNPPFSEDNLDMIIASVSAEGIPDSFAVVLIPANITEQYVEKSPKNAPVENNSGIGLNMSELDDLSRVTSFDSSDSSGFRETSMSGTVKAPKENIDMLLDIELDVMIELGRSALSIKRILELAPGSIVELDRMAGEPVDLMVNNKVVARGEVVVIDESFGIRIVSLVSPEERIKSLR